MGSRMVGREVPLAALRRLATSAASGEPGAALVIGEAGIGKTRLVTELVDELRHDDVCVLQGHCTAAGSRDVPLGPFLDALRDLRRGLGEPLFDRVAGGRLADLRQLLPELADPASGRAVTLSPAQVQWSTAGLLRDAASERPVLLVLEDVHWSDQSSRDVLDYLVRSLRNERLAVVLTVRTDDPAYDDVGEFVAELASLRRTMRVELDRLGPDEVAEQVRDLGENTSVPELARVVDLSGGVPLLVEELVTAGPADLERVAGRLLGHRLQRLPAAGHSVVDAAAVAVLDIGLDDLAAVAGLTLEEFDCGLAAAVAGGVLTRRGGSVAFRHALLREAAVAVAPPSHARAAHRAWAGRLERRDRDLPVAVAVARHWTAGDRPGPALHAWLHAAVLAEQVSAYPEQTRMLTEAAALWSGVPPGEHPPDMDLAYVLTRAAEAATLGLGRPDLSQRLLADARSALPADAPAARRAWLTILWDRSLRHRDDHLTWHEAMETAGDIPADPPSRERAVACLWASGICQRAAHLDEAHTLASEAVLVSEAVGDLELVAHARSALAVVESARGDDAQAVATAQEAARLADRTHDLHAREHAHMVLSIVLWTAGRDIESMEVTERLVELLGGDEPGAMPAPWALAKVNLAEGLLDLGRWDEAADVLERTLTRSDLPDPVFWSGVRLRDQLALWRGQPLPDRTGWPEGPRVHNAEDTDIDNLLAARYTYLQLSVREDEPAFFRQAALSAIEDDRVAMNPGYLHPLLGVVAQAEADWSEAGAPDAADGDPVVIRIEHLLDVAPPRNDRDLAWVAVARADLERRAGRDSPEAWTRAVNAWRGLGQPHPLGWALLRSGVQEAAHGRSTEARRALAEALAIGEMLGAEPLVDAVLAAGRQARLRLSPATATAAGLGLTERELDVLRLVAEGATNASIGQALFISPKTVSVHVSHILDKLGVASRGEAAAAAHRHGVAGPPPPPS